MYLTLTPQWLFPTGKVRLKNSWQTPLLTLLLIDLNMFILGPFSDLSA